MKVPSKKFSKNTGSNNSNRDILSQLDYNACPEAFTTAFEKHIKAWIATIPVLDKYPDLRGEMHDVFDIIEAGEHQDTFKALVKAIWDSWAEVEEAMKQQEK